MSIEVALLSTEWVHLWQLSALMIELTGLCTFVSSCCSRSSTLMPHRMQSPLSVRMSARGCCDGLCICWLCAALWSNEPLGCNCPHECAFDCWHSHGPLSLRRSSCCTLYARAVVRAPVPSALQQHPSQVCIGHSDACVMQMCSASETMLSMYPVELMALIERVLPQHTKTLSSQE